MCSVADVFNASASFSVLPFWAYLQESGWALHLCEASALLQITHLLLHHLEAYFHYLGYPPPTLDIPICVEWA